MHTSMEPLAGSEPTGRWFPVAVPGRSWLRMLVPNTCLRRRVRTSVLDADSQCGIVKVNPGPTPNTPSPTLQALRAVASTGSS